MRVLWICGLPSQVQEKALGGEDHGSQASWSWILAHLPSPPEIDLHIACLWPGGDRIKTFEFSGATFHLVPCPRRGRALLLFQRDTHYFKEIFQSLKPNIVHGWGTEDSFGLVARRLAPEHHVIEIQGLTAVGHRYFPRTYRTAIVRLTERLTLRSARYVVAESAFALAAAARLCPRAFKCVIEQPLRFRFLASESSDGTQKNVLFVGTIRASKGIMDALAAFSHAAPNDWTFRVIGRGTRKDEEQMYEFVHSNGFGHRFEHYHHATEDELISAMKTSSVFLLPTLIDSGPTALKEALTIGLWPVCYDNSGPGEYIRKYKFGSLAENRNLASLKYALKRCLIETPWKTSTIRRTLAAKTRHDFSKDKAWDAMISLYKEVCGSRRNDEEFNP